MTNQTNHNNNVVQNACIQPAVDLYSLDPGDLITLTGVDLWVYRGLSNERGRILIEHNWHRESEAGRVNKFLAQLNASCFPESPNLFSVNDIPGSYSPVTVENPLIDGCVFSVDYLFNPVLSGEVLKDPLATADHWAALSKLKDNLIGLEIMDYHGDGFTITDIHLEELSFFFTSIHFVPFTSVSLTPIGRAEHVERVDLRRAMIEYRSFEWAKKAKEKRREYQHLEWDISNAEKSKPVESDPSYVYRMWDKNGVLLYIGKSNNQLNRWKQHRKKPWFKQVTRFEYEPHPDEAAAYAAEREAIKTEHPLYNIVNNGVK